tara:strand:- start:4210 stop:5397 length:1188 start_codon:yes stop_codon:yes gene_type:complete
MKKILLTLCLLISINSNGQFLKEVYKDFLKYGTFYVAGDVQNAYEETTKDYFVRKPEDGNLYDVPEVIDVTEYYPNDYRIGVGFRKLARFDYEVKAKNYYDGTENNKALSAPTAAVKGLEYLLHYEKERERGEEFYNSRFFIRHTGKYHIVKLEQREEGNVGFKYQSVEARARLPIGKKFSISAGAIYRTHQTPYGYNPIEIWLNELQDNGYIKNPWYSLGYLYGYSDHYTTYTDNNTGNKTRDWIWKDEDGGIVAYSDLDFRNTVFGDLMNKYNDEQWDLLDPFGEITPIVGFDFYHYRKNFWMHGYGSYLLPYHKYIKGEEQFSYLHRNGWGKEGHNRDHTVTEGEQWNDYQAGLILGWKLSKSIGIFAEGEYTKFWDSEILSSSVGINFTFR